jgi:hypothetical protein
LPHIFGSAYDLPAPALLALFDGIADRAAGPLIVGLATRSSASLDHDRRHSTRGAEGWANYLPAALAVAIIALGPARYRSTT